MHIDNIFPVELADAAQRLADVLQQHQTQIVFAESCTAGLVSASLAMVPGISKWLCGSAVTYQEATKVRWVGVQPQDLENFTAVSEQVAAAMAVGVLRVTPHADLAVSVTGHLGPNAPPELDGVIFIGTAVRIRSGETKSGLNHPLGGQLLNDAIEATVPERIVLHTRQRQERQVEAATAVLLAAAKLVQMRT